MAKALLAAVGIAVAAIASVEAHAQQSYPEKTIRVVSPFPPGGVADTIARALAQKMTESFGRTAVVENRPGAGGTIGTDYVAKSPPDGHVLLVGNVSTLAVAPSVYTKLPYDPQQDVSPITLVGRSPMVYAVHPSVPAKTPKELIALARAQPGRMTFGSSGAGSITHFAGELLNAAGKVSITHVPYKGAAAVIQSMLSGEVDMGVLQVLETLPHQRSGRLRVIAVSGTQRSAAMSEVPTAAELGLRGLEATVWYCVVGPRGMPQGTIKTLHAALAKAIASPDFVKRFTADGVIPESSSPEGLAKIIRDDVPRWAEVAKRTGVKLD